jgi:hypothetical protein
VLLLNTELFSWPIDIVGCVDIGLANGTTSVTLFGVDSSGDSSPNEGISCIGEGMNAGRAFANSF